MASDDVDASASEEEIESIDVLERKLAQYRAELEDARARAKARPEDDELRELEVELREVVAMTEDVLATARECAMERENDEEGDGMKPARTNATSESMRKTFVGKDVLALGDDSQWRRGRCVRVAEDGALDVYLTESHVRVRVVASRVKLDVAPATRERKDEEEVREVYKGVPEPKRLELTRRTEYSRVEPPKKLEILPTDDAETRELKKKKLKSFKYKQRQQEISAEQNAKASSWQNFQQKGMSKRKPGFSKESIFSKKQTLGD